jgi:hypothetical protein
MMFNTFRVALYRKEVVVRDKVLLSQMSAAKMEAWRFEITVGHDDVFFAAILGWIAKEQFHPIRCNPRGPRNVLLTPDDFAAAQIALTGRADSAERARLEYGLDPFSTAFGALLQNSNDHLRALEKYNRAKKRIDRLAGV